MKIILDEHEYSVDLTKTIELIRFIYLKLNNEGITLKDGETLKLGDHSILRTSLKAIMTPMVIPMLRKMYAEKHIILDPPVRHTDLIDYSVNALCDFLSIIEKRLNVILASKVIDNSRSSIESITTTWEEPLAIEPPTFTDSSKDD